MLTGEMGRASGSLAKTSSNLLELTDSVIFRMGTGRESVTRLNRKALDAENTIGIHCVSGSVTRPDVPCSSATCSRLESAGFNVISTPTRRDPGHVTIELPKPVTKAVAEDFNKAFGR